MPLEVKMCKMRSSHQTKEHEKPAAATAKCADCGGDHPAFCLGCIGNSLNKPKLIGGEPTITPRQQLLWGQEKNENVRTQPLQQQPQQTQTQVPDLKKMVMEHMVQAMFQQFQKKLNKMTLQPARV